MIHSSLSRQAAKEYVILAAASLLFCVWKGTDKWVNRPAVTDEAAASTYSCSQQDLSHPLSLGSLDQADDPDKRETTITCDFRLSKPTKDTDGFIYPNLFQTSAVNQGIRLEFSISRRSGAAWGLIIADAEGRTVTVPLPSFPEYDRWYRISIDIESTVVIVSLDNKLLFRSGRVRLKYQINDVTVGAGFSNTRVFIGKIRNFRIATHDPSIGRTPVGQILSILLPFSIVLLLTVAVLSRLKPISPESSLTVRAMGFASLLLGTILCVYFRSKILPRDGPGDAGMVLLGLSLVVPVNIIGFELKRREVKFGTPLRWLFIGSAAMATLCLALVGLYCEKIGLSATARASLLNFDEVGAIFQSNFIESVGFFFSTFSSIGLLLCLMCAASTAVSVAILLLYPFCEWRRPTVVVACLMAAVFGLTITDVRSGLVGLIRPTLANIAEQAQLFEAAKSQRASVIVPLATKPSKGETYIVVIGEAANREHLGVYGYFRPTTPWMTAATKNKSEWLLFQNAYSGYCHTIPSLMLALTSANQYNGKSDVDSPSIIETAKAAGFKTYWLSEQGVSWGDTPLNALASEADYVRFVRPVGRIAELFDRTLATIDRERNNLIVVHLIGSHAPYASRYPVGYAPGFLEDQKYLTALNKIDSHFVRDFLNEYDTSINYTDNELKAIWNSVQKHAKGVNAFVYFADHGEDVEGMKFHNASVFTFPMSHIPLAIGVSEEWKVRYPEIFRTLEGHKDSYFTLDLFYNLFLGLANIRTRSNQSQFDLTSPVYSITRDLAVTMTPPKTLQAELYAKASPRRISDDPFVRTRSNVSYLVAHFGNKFIREYSDYIPTPFNAAAMGYTGVEINIAVPQMTVGHYPEVISDFPLEIFLRLEPMRHFRKIWFDLKLQTGHNLNECFDAFSRIDKASDIKSRGIIESWDPGLQRFSEDGWTTSYYLYDGNWPKIKLSGRWNRKICGYRHRKDRDGPQSESC